MGVDIKRELEMQMNRDDATPISGQIHVMSSSSQPVDVLSTIRLVGWNRAPRSSSVDSSIGVLGIVEGIDMVSRRGPPRYL